MKTATRPVSRKNRNAPAAPAQGANRRWILAGGLLIAIAIVATCAIAMLHNRPKEPTPPGMVWVPAGEFVMGTDDPHSMPNERPAHRVKVDGFWMDEHD